MKTQYGKSHKHITRAAILLLASSSIASPRIVQAATCGQCVRPVRHIAVTTPVIKQVTQAPVYYRVGQQLQRQAIDTYGFRQSAEYLDYLRLKGFEAGVQAVHARQAVDASTDQTTQPAPSSADDTAGSPSASPGSAAADRYPTLIANCAKCHSSDNPEGGIWLDGTAPLTGPDAAAKRDAIVRMLWNEQMPPNKPAADDVVGAILSELYAE